MVFRKSQGQLNTAVMGVCDWSDIFMKPSVYLHNFTNKAAVFVADTFAILFLVLTPLASCVADVKFNQFNMLILKHILHDSIK